MHFPLKRPRNIADCTTYWVDAIPYRWARPDVLHLDQLMQRIEKLGTKEVVIALDATLEGDATALYLKQVLNPLQLNVSRFSLRLTYGQLPRLC